MLTSRSAAYSGKRWWRRRRRRVFWTTVYAVKNAGGGGVRAGVNDRLGLRMAGAGGVLRCATEPTNERASSWPLLTPHASAALAHPTRTDDRVTILCTWFISIYTVHYIHADLYTTYELQLRRGTATGLERGRETAGTCNYYCIAAIGKRTFVAASSSATRKVYVLHVGIPNYDHVIVSRLIVFCTILQWHNN